MTDASYLKIVDPFMNANPPTDDSQSMTVFSQGSNSISGVDTISVGNGTQVFRMDKQGLWLGADVFLDAPFSVDMQGNLIAHSGNISANITLGGTNNNSGVLKLFDNTNTQVLQLDKNGLTVYGLTNAITTAISPSGGNTASIGTDGSGNFVIQAAVGINMIFQARNNATFQMGVFANGTLQVNGNLTVSGTITGSVTIPSSLTLSHLNVNNSLNEIIHNGVSMRAFNSGGQTGGGPPRVIFDNPGHSPLIDIGGDVKTAVVETEKGYRELYCLESPEVWFMDIINTNEGIDPVFLEVTEGSMKIVKCVDGSEIVFRRRKDFVKKRFSQVDRNTYLRNNQFWSRQRKD